MLQLYTGVDHKALLARCAGCRQRQEVQRTDARLKCRACQFFACWNWDACYLVNAVARYLRLGPAPHRIHFGRPLQATVATKAQVRLPYPVSQEAPRGGESLCT